MLYVIFVAVIFVLVAIRENEVKQLKRKLWLAEHRPPDVHSNEFGIIFAELTNGFWVMDRVVNNATGSVHDLRIGRFDFTYK